MVKPLRYKLEGRWFDSRWYNWNFYWLNTSGCTMTLGSTQCLTEMSTRNISWGERRLVVELTTLSPSCSNCLQILEPGTLRSSPVLYRDCFTFTFYNNTISSGIRSISFCSFPVQNILDLQTDCLKAINQISTN